MIYFSLAGSVQTAKKILHKPLSLTCTGSVVIGSSAASLVLVSSCRVGVQRPGMVMRRRSFRKLNQASPCIGVLPPLLLAPGVSPKTDLEISLLGREELLEQSLGVPLIS